MTRLAYVCLAACSGEVGTIQLELVTAPGSTVLDAVDTLRVTLTDPPVVVEAPRTAAGFDLVLDVEATGAAASLIVEGFAGDGGLVATGMSPPFGVSAVDARIRIYVAAPMTIAAAPATLPAARTGVATTSLSYGFVVAGGEDAETTRTDSIFLYNAFDHTLLAGKTMPAPRSFQTLATGASNSVYLFGGIGSDGAPTGSLWRFDTNAQPNGAYTEQPDLVELARDHAVAVALEPERFVISGSPPIDLSFGTATARTDIASVGAGAATTIDGEAIGVFVGDPLLQLRDGGFQPFEFGSEPDASIAPAGRFVLIPSFRGTTEVAVVSPIGLTNGMFLDRQSVVRRGAAIAATSRHVVIAGGLDELGSPIATADILDVADFTLIATIPCTARARASAIALPNDQIAIVGGEPANDTIELFTPSPPIRE